MVNRVLDRTMRFPTAPLEGKKLSRVIFSVRPSGLPDQGIPDLLRKLYEMDAWCFDLPSLKHLGSFRELKRLTDDDAKVAGAVLSRRVDVAHLPQ